MLTPYIGMINNGDGSGMYHGDLSNGIRTQRICTTGICIVMVLECTSGIYPVGFVPKGFVPLGFISQEFVTKDSCDEVLLLLNVSSPPLPLAPLGMGRVSLFLR